MTPPAPAGAEANGPAIAGVILSAGASRRMGTPKALLQFKGETFLDGLIGRFHSVCRPVVAVLGYHADAVRAGLRRADQAIFAMNPDPERGMLSSLQAGLALLPPTCGAALFTPVDYPNIQAATIARLCQAFRDYRAPVTVPVYRGAHGHPVCVSREVVAELLTLPVDAQARDLIHKHRSSTLYLDVEDAGVLGDIDTPAEYQALTAGERQ